MNALLSVITLKVSG